MGGGIALILRRRNRRLKIWLYIVRVRTKITIPRIRKHEQVKMISKYLKGLKVIKYIKP